MKILYFSNHDLESHSGVVNKIKGQVQEWAKQGHEVYIFCTHGLKLFNSDFELIDSYKLSWKVFRKTSYLKVIMVHIFSLLASLKIKPDIAYSRYFLYSPFLSLIYVLFPTVIEINGDDKAELLNANPLLRFYNLLTREFIFLGVRGYVFVSKELSEKTPFKKNRIVIPNGIDSTFIKSIKHVKLPSDKQVHVGFSGTANQHWHGIEKLIPYFERAKDLHLHIVGLEGNSTDQISYYGRLNTIENLQLLQKCSICVSTLALHRKNMEEASPLKSREYVLLGKRFIYAYEDADLDSIASERPELFLKLPNTESNVEDNWGLIDRFIRMPFDEDTTKEIRNIGLTNLTYEKKEEVRVSFFKSLMIKND